MVRHIAVLLALFIVTALAVSAVSPDDVTGTATDWPPMRITYETILHPQPGSTLQNRRVTELTYLGRDDWHDEVVEATFTAGSAGATREFRDGVFTQNFPEAGRPIVEEIPAGRLVIPERWLSVVFMMNAEDMGFQSEVIDDGLVKVTRESTMPCDQLLPDIRPGGCYSSDTVTDREIVIARTDLSSVPVPVEHRYMLDDVVGEETVVLEVVLLDGAGG